MCIRDRVYGSSHAYTEDTQTNWNGIIGRIELQLASSIAVSYTHLITQELIIEKVKQMHTSLKRDFMITNPRIACLLYTSRCVEETGATRCVSSQVGCKMNRLFCQTGKQGFEGSLPAGRTGSSSCIPPAKKRTAWRGLCRGCKPSRQICRFG